ncbi:MAG: class B sortase [Bacilli bacterium]|nr:class B sortase [Bacilli bacterium]
MNKKIGNNIVSILTIILVLTGFFFFYEWYKENNKNEKLKDDLIRHSNQTIKTDEYPYITTNLSSLIKQNKETIGWVKVPNTNINYPVVQTKDNSFYLNYDFDKKENTAGWIFLDYRNHLDNSDNNYIIYGHNRLDNSMFGTLKNTMQEDWYKNNKYIFFNTINSYLTYKVFSIYSIDKDDFKSNINLITEEDYKEYINNSLQRSIYNFNVSVTTQDQLLTLYTCDNDNENRTILQAKLVQQKDAIK